MKRLPIHIAFATVALMLTVLLVSQWVLLNKSNTIAKVLSHMPEKALATDAKPEGVAKSGLLRLAWANALSKGAELEAAETIYVDLINQHQFDDIGQAAYYNLANAYLRRGTRDDLPLNQTRALLELAKQRYRDLLRTAPNHWDARYNLERTLRLAPENRYTDEAKGEPIKRVNVVVPDFQHRDLP